MGGEGHDFYYIGRKNPGTGSNDDLILDDDAGCMAIYGNYGPLNGGTDTVVLSDLSFDKGPGMWKISLDDGTSVTFDPTKIVQIDLREGPSPDGNTQVLKWNGTTYDVYDENGANFLGYSIDDMI
ncbi:MAG: hypothetical protein RIB84_00105 [Sneathiellaceae bacterium]